MPSTIIFLDALALNHLPQKGCQILDNLLTQHDIVIFYGPESKQLCLSHEENVIIIDSDAPNIVATCEWYKENTELVHKMRTNTQNAINNAFTRNQILSNIDDEDFIDM